MRKSLSRIKKYLSPQTPQQNPYNPTYKSNHNPQNTNNPSNNNLESNHTKTMSLTQTKKCPTLPEILCENEDLKERISLLEKEKELLRKEMEGGKRRESLGERNGWSRDKEVQEVNRTMIMRVQESPISQKGQHESRFSNFSRHSKPQSQQKYTPSRSSHSPSSQSPQKRPLSSIKAYSRPSRLLSPNPNPQHYTHNQPSTSSLLQQLSNQQQQNHKLSLKIMRLNLTIENQQKEKKQMLGLMAELREKLKESTEYILGLDKAGGNRDGDGYLEQLKEYIEKEKTRDRQKSQDHTSYLNISQSSPSPTTNPYIQSLLQQLEQAQYKLQDYYPTKDQNYKLRNQVATLLLANKILKEKVIYRSKAIQHLWRVKQVELENCWRVVEGMRVVEAEGDGNGKGVGGKMNGIGNDPGGIF